MTRRAGWTNASPSTRRREVEGETGAGRPADTAAPAARESHVPESNGRHDSHPLNSAIRMGRRWGAVGSGLVSLDANDNLILLSWLRRLLTAPHRAGFDDRRIGPGKFRPRRRGPRRCGSPAERGAAPTPHHIGNRPSERAEGMSRGRIKASLAGNQRAGYNEGTRTIQANHYLDEIVITW